MDATKTRPDWEHWWEIDQIALWTAVALSCDIAPFDLASHSPGKSSDDWFFDPEIDHNSYEFDRRLIVAESHLGTDLIYTKLDRDRDNGRCAFTKVRLIDFSLWALRIMSPPWSLPNEFPRMSKAQIEHLLKKPYGAGNLVELRVESSPKVPRLGPANAEEKPTGSTIQLPHTTKTLDALFRVMRENWSNCDKKNPPKQNLIAAEIDTALAWAPQSDGSPSRSAQTLAAAIRPDELAERDRRLKTGRRCVGP